MWIKTEAGFLANAALMTAITPRPVPVPGSSPADAGYEKGLTFKVVAETDRDAFLLAEGLTNLEAEALMERLWCGVRHAQYVSVPVELAAIRALLAAKGGAA